MTLHPLPAAASAERIEAALRRSSPWAGIGVSAVTLLDTDTTLLSHIFRLGIAYADPAAARAAGAPASLILKAGLAEREGGPWSGGEREVAFYRDVAPAMAGVVPLCHEAQWDSVTGLWHLLLEDFTDTHQVPSRWPLPPTAEQCEGIVRARARLHASWWDDPRLGTSVGSAHSPATVAQAAARLAECLPGFADRLGDALSPERRLLYERLIAEAPRLLGRWHAGSHLTIVHGDAHFWNCFVPRAGGIDGARFFDWDAWRIGIGAADLAYMLAVHWYPDLRSRREAHLLDCYHTELLAHGVTGYDRNALQYDYRLAVLWETTKPVWQQNSGLPPLVWWNNFERIHMAVDDLGCGALLKAG